MSEQTGNDSLFEMFIFETIQNTQQIEKIILETEKNSVFTEDAINEIFRIMHTIKGSSAMMSFAGMARLAHKAEDMFYFIRENSTAQYDILAVNDLVLSCNDYISKQLIRLQHNEPTDETEVEDIISRIDRILESMSAPKKVDIPVIPVQSYMTSFKISIKYDDGCEMENIRAYQLVNDLGQFSHVEKYIPEGIIDDDATAALIRKNGFIIYFNSDKTYKELCNFFERVPFIKEYDLSLGSIESTEDIGKEEHMPEEHEVKTETNEAAESKNVVKKAETQHSSMQGLISVNITKLDKLMNLVGELVISESMVVGNPDLQGLELQSFQREAMQLHKIIVEMQDIVMSMRMVPLMTTFQKTNRIIRDMSKKLDKEIKLVLNGGETEVDKNIIEHLSDPLMHLVRNCIDHGIETSQERVANGKAPEGTVTLEAYNSGSNVYINVKDDGRGLNKKKIIEKAEKQNLLPRPAEDMTDKEIYNLIFLPGFSTKEQVSEFSGRGVGMDVVMQSITSVGGTVYVESNEGKGTTITIKIPLTVAIIDGMNIEIGTKKYTLPIQSIVEFFKLDKKSIIKSPDGSELVMVRGECYAVIRLDKHLQATDSEGKPDSDLQDGILVMIDQEGKRRCLYADRLLGQQQVVVKTLPEIITKSKMAKGISGCTLLGDGSISLILDTGWIVNTEII